MLYSPEWHGSEANKADTDQMLHGTASDLSQHCLLR